MVESNKFYKKNPSDVIWWVDNSYECRGEFIFSFDKKETFNLFSDYPWKLTAKEKKIFDKENPFWANFFEDR
jgi:hypothetical protein